MSRIGNVSTKAVLVSVVIPCFNQGRFLHEAIESVLAQTYTCFEIIVVNDGSTDNTAAVAVRYPGLRYMRQDNQGLAAARNTGIRYSTGAYLVFLDADDRLLPGALACGADYLDAHPQCALVSGHYRHIAADGSVLPTWREQRLGSEHCFMSGAYELIGADGAVRRTWPQPRVASEHYTMLLQRNYIAMHATVMYRRTVFDTVGGFDTSFRACEDYDLYLRIARQFPIACHDHVVAEYRRHRDSMSGNSALMLTTALAVLRSQWAYVAGNRTYETAFKIGEKTWQSFYAGRALKEAYIHLTRGTLTQALKAILVLWSHGRSTANSAVQHATAGVRSQLGVGWKRLRRLPIGRVNFGALRRVSPLPGATGSPMGQAVDQYYRERFLHDHANDVQGRVLQLQADDFRAASDLPADAYDCLMLPHILQDVYTLRAAVRTAHRLLRPGGVLLATLPGVSKHQGAETAYWGWTAQLARRLVAEMFPHSRLTVETYGNVLAATASLHGISAYELCPEELDYRDAHYPIVVAVRAVKPQTAGQSGGKNKARITP